MNFVSMPVDYMIKLLQCTALGWLWLSSLLAIAGPLDTWYWRNPLPQGNTYNGACYGGGLFVAVGEYGTIVISPDGRTWLPQSSGTELILRDVCYGDGRFVAVGDFGTVVTSPDGRHWTVQDSSWFSHLNAVTWGKGKYVAVGEETTILVSTNGADWDLEGMGSTPLFGITFGNDRFVAVGGHFGEKDSAGDWISAGVTNLVLTSADGARWQRHQIPSASCLVAVCYGKGSFIAATYNAMGSGTAHLFYSHDAIQWNLATIPSEEYDTPAITTICATTNAFYAFYGGASLNYGWLRGYCLRSDTGKNWVRETLPGDCVLEGAAASPNTVVAAGFAYYPQSPPLWFRNPTGTWEEVTSGRDMSPETIQWLGGKFIGLCYAEDVYTGARSYHIALSTNGTAWSRVLNGSYHVAFANGLYVAVGSAGRVAISSNAETWTIKPTGFTNDLFNLAAGNGAWVAGAAGGTVIHSTNGITWTRHRAPWGDMWSHIIFGNGIFMGTPFWPKSSATYWVSPDGLAWEPRSPTSNIWLSMRFWQDRFIGGDTMGDYYVSTNGLNWTQIWEHPSMIGAVMVGYSDGQYLVVADYWDYPYTHGGFLLASSDGQNWEQHHLPTLHTLKGMVFGNNTVIVTDQ